MIRRGSGFGDFGFEFVRRNVKDVKLCLVKNNVANMGCAYYILRSEM